LKSRVSSDGSDDADKAVELARLSATYPMQGQAETDADLRAEAYFEALDGLPAWAVGEARRLIVKGDTEFGKPWGPTVTEFADLVRSVVAPVKDDLAAVEQLLAARPIGEQTSPAERARVVSGFDKLKVEIAGRARG
jgi:hypothetical protein